MTAAADLLVDGLDRVRDNLHALIDGLQRLRVLVPHERGRGSIGMSSSSAMSTGLPVDGTVAGLDRHHASARVDQPSAFQVGLIRERGRDLLNIDLGQVELPPA